MEDTSSRHADDAFVTIEENVTTTGNPLFNMIVVSNTVYVLVADSYCKLL
jgi:hypothetical protein